MASGSHGPLNHVIFLAFDLIYISLLFSWILKALGSHGPLTQVIFLAFDLIYISLLFEGPTTLSAGEQYAMNQFD